MIKTLRNLSLILLSLIIVIWFAGSQPLFLSIERVESPYVDSKKLESHVNHLSEVLPGRIGQESALKPTIEWIEKQLSPYGKSYRQSFEYKDETFHNILINFETKLEDSDFVKSSDKSFEKNSNIETIIIGAHYDTAHGLPGADDNASGVAGLIELARLLSEYTSKNNQKLKHRIQLAFYTLEEPPYFRTKKMGSYVHAKQLKTDEQKVKLMISLDMIGYFSDEENSQHLLLPLMDKIYPTQGNFIAIISDLSNMLAVRSVKSHFRNGTDLPVYSFNAPKFVSGIDFSDHLNFWYHDYPAIMITDTSFNRYRHYHTEQDTAEKLDYERMAKVVKGVYQTAIGLAKSDK